MSDKNIIKYITIQFKKRKRKNILDKSSFY